MPVSSNSLPCPVATDLDGTIVRSGGAISPRTVSALAHFRSARFADDTRSMEHKSVATRTSRSTTRYHRTAGPDRGGAATYPGAREIRARRFGSGPPRALRNASTRHSSSTPRCWSDMQRSSADHGTGSGEVLCLHDAALGRLVVLGLCRWPVCVLAGWRVLGAELGLGPGGDRTRKQCRPPGHDPPQLMTARVVVPGGKIRCRSRTGPMALAALRKPKREGAAGRLRTLLPAPGLVLAG